jgi:acetyl-CoA C-acetyltransferase
LREVEHAELYSCFPVAVRVQQRELGLAEDGVPTITGGMAFAGGPFNNFVLQATVAMAERLRAERGSLGLVTTVSGLLTKPGLAIWSSAVPDAGPLVADLAAEATAATATVESVRGYEGDATVATYTVAYDGQRPARVIAIGDTPDGRRCVAIADDADLALQATQDDQVGTAMRVNGTAFVSRG